MSDTCAVEGAGKGLVEGGSGGVAVYQWELGSKTSLPCPLLSVTPVMDGVGARGSLGASTTFPLAFEFFGGFVFDALMLEDCFSSSLMDFFLGWVTLPD